LQRLREHAWPGNVRELQNLCWRLAALAPADLVTPQDLDGLLPATGDVQRPSDAPVHADSWDDALRAWADARLRAGDADIHAQARERLDRALLETALVHTGGRRAEAATRLGVGRNTLTRKLGARGRRG